MVWNIGQSGHIRCKTALTTVGIPRDNKKTVGTSWPLYLWTGHHWKNVFHYYNRSADSWHPPAAFHIWTGYCSLADWVWWMSQYCPDLSIYRIPIDRTAEHENWTGEHPRLVFPRRYQVSIREGKNCPYTPRIRPLMQILVDKGRKYLFSYQDRKILQT